MNHYFIDLIVEPCDYGPADMIHSALCEYEEYDGRRTPFVLLHIPIGLN